MEFDLLKIKNILDTQVCPIHKQSSKVSIIDDKIQTTPCCEEFGIELSKITEIEFKEQTNDFIISMVGEFQAKFQQ